MTVQISERWQITIPKNIRKELSLKKKQKVEFVKIGGHYSLIKIPEDPIKALMGSTQAKKSFKEIIKEGRAEWGK